jgi:hypothetical protein
MYVQRPDTPRSSGVIILHATFCLPVIRLLVLHKVERVESYLLYMRHKNQ